MYIHMYICNDTHIHIYIYIQCIASTVFQISQLTMAFFGRGGATPVSRGSSGLLWPAQLSHGRAQRDGDGLVKPWENRRIW